MLFFHEYHIPILKTEERIGVLLAIEVTGRSKGELVRKWEYGKQLGQLNE